MLPMYLSVQVCVSSVSCRVNSVSICLSVCQYFEKLFRRYQHDIEEISWTRFDKGFNVSVFKGDDYCFPICLHLICLKESEAQLAQLCDFWETKHERGGETIGIVS